MRIAEMFVKPIDRDIKGVIKVGQDDEDNIFQELDEYVVTRELLKHFRSFFESYKRGINGHTDKMGVWISGFFGSGKSHFLKILSYLLENREVKGKKAIDFFTDGSKIDDSMIIADIRLAENVSTDVILFNIDSKSEAGSKSSKDAIIDVFMKVFNDMQGFCGALPFLADLERRLSDEGTYEGFKRKFREVTGSCWEESREDFYFIQDDLVHVLFEQGIMSTEAGRTWCEKAPDTYTLSIEKFASLVKSYCDKKSKNHHIVFLVDEIGQYIADDSRLMLNLQTVAEDLGTACGGKAWVIVTSQQSIDEVVKVRGSDFSKIQGRFDTRLSLSSANVDEVIRKRILEKTDTGRQTLKLLYDQKESVIKNLITFTGEVEKKLYADRDEFAAVYPFISYQFNLLQQVLTAIRIHSSSGKNLAEGERSMIALFKESAMTLMAESEGALVPFYLFYNALDQFIDHTHRIVIKQGEENTKLLPIDVECLKILFMIKHVKEIKATIENLTTLMVTKIDDDRIDLRKKVEASLNRLMAQTLVQKNGDLYMFLTNEEQDINRAIQNEAVEMGEIINEAAIIIFQEILKENKYRYSNRYNFPYNQSVDGRFFKNSQAADIGVHIITPYNDQDYQAESLRSLAMQKAVVLVHLPSDATFLNEVMETLKISKFMTKQGSSLDKNFGSIKRAKQDELIEKKQRIQIFIEEAIKNADIYVCGSQPTIAAKDPKTRINDALGKLVNTHYNKLYYMDTEPSLSDIEAIFKPAHLISIDTSSTQAANHLALNDMLNVIELQSQRMKISLKFLLKHYSEAPYGFIDWDVRWLIAMLFKQGKVNLILNSQTISMIDTDARDIIHYLTKNQFVEKLRIEKRFVVSDVQIKSAKEVIKDLFSITAVSDDEDELIKTFKRNLKVKLKNIDETLFEYRFENRYPGKEILKQIKEMFLEIDDLTSVREFFNYVHTHRDDLLDAADDLKPITDFFDGEQKQILERAFNYIDIYQKSKTYIVDQELIDTISQIKSIAKKPNPYHEIYKLPALLDSYGMGHATLVSNEVEPVKEAILVDQETVLAQLLSDEVKVEFESRVLRIFMELIDKLITTNEIAAVKSMRYESETLRERFLNEIVAYRNKIDIVYPPPGPGSGPGVGEEPPPQVKTIRFQSLASKVTIKEERDVDAFIQAIKEELLKELGNNNDIIIKLTN